MNRNSRKFEDAPFKVKYIQLVNKQFLPSTLAQIKTNNIRILWDSGAAVNCLNEQVYRQLNVKSQLQKSGIVLKSVSGSVLPVLGTVQLSVKLQGQLFPTLFYVIRNMKHNAILGRDFMHKYKVTLDMGNNTCHLRNMVLPLDDLCQMRNLIRLTDDVAIPPNYVVTVQSKCHKKIRAPYGSNLLIEQENGGFLGREPGLSVITSLDTCRPNRKITLSIVNQTGRHFKLHKGNVVANCKIIDDDYTISEVTQTFPNQEKQDVTDPNAGIKDLEHANLTPSQQRQFLDLMQKNSDIFAKSEFDIGKCNLMKARIDTTTDVPIRMKPYRTPFAYRDEVKRQVDEMLDKGLIKPSQSDYASPILCVRKKSGETRLCIDFRALNNITKKYSYPMPLIDDLFTNLGKAKYFSSLDFIKGYYQIPMEESSKAKTAFIVANLGNFQFEFMPFGLCNAPAQFQSCMAKLLNGLDDCACSYLDDVVVYSSSFSKHMIHIQQVFDRIRDANMKLKRNKCEFFREEINYLGHVVTNQGELKVDPDKVKFIAELKSPTSVREVRSFLVIIVVLYQVMQLLLNL